MTTLPPSVRAVLAAAVLAAITGTLAAHPWTDSTAADPPTQAAAQLAGLTIAPLDPAVAATYSRDEFGGDVWLDLDHDGCDTRAEVLEVDMTDPVVRPAPRCLVLSGTYTDPYTGTTATVAASTLDIDHGVSLQDAWTSGAASWPQARRDAFANDPANLVPTTAHINRSKGDLGPDQWSPPNPAMVCGYATRYVAVKARYGLSVTQAQHDALAQDLATCGATPTPTAGG